MLEHVDELAPVLKPLGAGTHARAVSLLEWIRQPFCGRELVDGSKAIRGVIASARWRPVGRVAIAGDGEVRGNRGAERGTIEEEMMCFLTA